MSKITIKRPILTIVGGSVRDTTNKKTTIIKFHIVMGRIFNVVIPIQCMTTDGSIEVIAFTVQFWAASLSSIMTIIRKM